MRSHLLALAAVALGVGPTPAGEGAQGALDFVRVTARGVASAPADAVRLEARLSVVEASADRSLEELNEVAEAAALELAEAGVTVRRFGATPTYEDASGGDTTTYTVAAGGVAIVNGRVVRPGERKPVRGFTQTERLELTTKIRADAAPRAERGAFLLAAALDAGLEPVGAPRGTVRDLQALERRAVEDALAVARRRAAALAELADRRLGAVRSIRTRPGGQGAAPTVDRLEHVMEVTVDFALE